MQVLDSALSKSDIPNANQAKRIGKRGNRADRIHEFCILRKSGLTLAQIANSLGVNVKTAGNYEKLYKRRQENVEAKRRNDIADKAELASVLTDLIREDLEPRDKVQAIKAHAELMGHNAPSRSENLTVHVYPTTLDLLTSVRAERMAALAASANAQLAPRIGESAPTHRQVTAGAYVDVEAGGSPPGDGSVSEPDRRKKSPGSTDG